MKDKETCRLPSAKNNTKKLLETILLPKGKVKINEEGKSKNRKPDYKNKHTSKNSMSLSFVPYKLKTENKVRFKTMSKLIEPNFGKSNGRITKLMILQYL